MIPTSPDVKKVTVSADIQNKAIRSDARGPFLATGRMRTATMASGPGL